MARKKIFYGYFMLVCCLVMLVVSTGIVNNCAGQFVAPVCEALDMPRSQMTLYLSFQNTALMILVPFLGIIYTKIKPRLFATCGAALMAISFGMLSQCHEAWQFWICGFCIGAGAMTVSSTTVSIIMNNWFIKNKGLVIGIAMAGSGFGSMIFNPLGQHLIANDGYQTAYIVLAVIMACVFVPVLLLYRFKPEDMGLKPLGYEEAQAAKAKDGEVAVEEHEQVVREGYTYKEAIRSPKFYMLAFIILCLSGCSMGTFTHLQSYMTGTGMEGAFAASIIGVTSAFLMVGKVLWGRVRDWIGPRPTFVIALGCFVASYVVILFIPSNPMLSYLFAVLFGLSYATPTMFSPLLTIASFGERDFTKIYGSVQLFFYLGPIICNPLSGAIFDATSSYTTAWFLYGGVILLCLVVGFAMLSNKKKQPAKEMAEAAPANDAAPASDAPSAAEDPAAATK